MLKRLSASLSEIVDLLHASQADQQIACRPHRRIADARQRLRAEQQCVHPVEPALAGTKQCHDLQGVRAMVASITELDHHALVEIEFFVPHFLQDRVIGLCPGIHQVEAADRFADSQSPRCNGADWAIAIVDEPDIPGFAGELIIG